MDRIIRINMEQLSVSEEIAAEEYLLQGGRSLISTLALKEIDPNCHPLGPGNKLIIATGLLSGTVAPSSGRISIGGKSPLTGGIKESNAGGPMGHILAKLGVKAILIEGMPEAEDQLYIIRISPDGVEIVPAPSELVGKGCYFTGHYMRQHYGFSNKSAVMSIGPAGEMRCAAACISLTNMEGDSSRQAGRGGMGAVMGSKRIKAIVADNCNRSRTEYYDKMAFRTYAAKLAGQLAEGGAGLSANGTAQLVTPVNNVGALPVANFSQGSWENYECVTGQRIHSLAVERGGQWGHSCQPGCAIRCSNIFLNTEGHYVTGSLEFETVALFGPNCLINDLDIIAQIDYRCDDYGVDTIDTGISCGIAMEAGLLPWGDGVALISLIDEIGKQSVLGRLIASGAANVGRVLGQWRVPQTKGQAIAAYDPRGCKGTGVTYATSTMGGDHTVGNALPGRGGVDCKDTGPQSDLSRNLQLYTAYMLDSTGLCLFAGPSVNKAEIVSQLINARYGTQITAADIRDFGRNALEQEISFNRQAGVPDLDLPEMFRLQPLPPHNNVFDVKLNDIRRTLDFDYLYPEEQRAIF